MNDAWKVKREGAAFKATGTGTGNSGKTSLQQFKDDPDNLRIELEPVSDGISNIELHISFQVNIGKLPASITTNGSNCRTIHTETAATSPHKLHIMMRF